MGPKAPLGKRESHVLEFKGAAALAKPLSISRAVVAMLNAGGGEIWIGLREEGGIAIEVEHIPHVESAREGLLNHLIEVVEPRLRLGEDIALEAVAWEGRSLLRLTIRSTTSRGPFALLKDGGRHFLLRVDHRIRAMTREELFASPRGAPTPIRLHHLREEALKSGRSGLWIGVEPSPPLPTDVQAEGVRELLIDPAKAGNRAAGWNYGYPYSAGLRPRLGTGRIELGRDDLRKTTILEDGTVELWTAMASLRHGTSGVQEIHPLALLEVPISVLRLAARLYGGSAQCPERVFVDGALLRVGEWRLPAHPPGTYGHALRHGEPEGLEDDQFLLTAPFEIPWSEFEEHPDHAGYLLVRSIYQAFHLGEERIPATYDRLGRRLVLDD